jgi:hypothetical protein
MLYVLYPFVSYLVTLPRMLEFSTILVSQIYSASIKYYTNRLWHCTEIIKYNDSMNVI